MRNKSYKTFLYSLSALSLLALAGCNNSEDDAVVEESSQVSSSVESQAEASLSKEIDAIEARIKAIYQEAEEPEEDLAEEASEESQESSEEESEENFDLAEEDIQLEVFESEEHLSEDIADLQEEAEDEAGQDRLKELKKEYGIIETMYNVKKNLTDRYDIERGQVLEESELPADFMMQLQSLEEIKPVFYENYMGYYEDFVAATGLGAEQSDEESIQARINAIRAQIIAGDGSINVNISTAQLQAYYEELLALGAYDTAQALANEIERRNNPDTEDGSPLQAPEEPAAPSSPIERNQATQPARSSQPSRSQPSRTQPARTQAPGTEQSESSSSQASSNEGTGSQNSAGSDSSDSPHTNPNDSAPSSGERGETSDARNAE